MDYVESVERQLDLPSNDKKQVTKELKAHFDELKEEMMASGADEAQAEQEAARRLGEPKFVAAQLNNVHSRMSWRSAVLAAVPVLVAALIGCLRPLPQPRPSFLSPWFVSVIAFAAITLVGCVREFARDRRPVWTATWLAGALISITVLLNTYRYGRGDSVGYASLLGMLPTAVLLGTALWASWRVPKLRWAAILAQLCYFGFVTVNLRYIHPGAMSPSPWIYLAQASGGIILGLIIPVVIAIGIFALHRSSNAYVASLFLFVLQMATPVIGSALSRSPAGGAYVLLMISAIIFFARSGSWRLKVFVLCLPPVAIQLAGGFTMTYRTTVDLIGSAVWLMSIIMPVALVPLLFERTRKGDRPEVVR